MGSFSGQQAANAKPTYTARKNTTLGLFKTAMADKRKRCRLFEFAVVTRVFVARLGTVRYLWLRGVGDFQPIQAYEKCTPP